MNATTARGEYGSSGRVGVVTPQSNPHVESEIRLLLPSRVAMNVARCVSGGEPRQRLEDYVENLGDTIGRFGNMALDVLGFACTGSAYTLGAQREQALFLGLQERFGYPVVSASQAIDSALKHLGAQRIALACPYPDWLLAAARAYWESLGYDIGASLSLNPSMGDTRGIYAMDTQASRRSLLNFLTRTDAEVSLITGTGMPSLRTVADAARDSRRVVISSNLCLAWKCLQAAGIPVGDRTPNADFPLLAGWASELDTL